MKKPLTHQALTSWLDYDPDTGIFRRKQPRGGAVMGAVAGYKTKKGYWSISVRGQEYYAHRLAWFYANGRWPGSQIDHINRNPLDNRLRNLREASQVLNNQNHGKYSNNSSGHPGVYWHKPSSNWTAMIFRKGRSVSLGYFKDFDEAVAARERAVQEHYGRSSISGETSVSIREPQI